MKLTENGNIKAKNTFKITGIEILESGWKAIPRAT